jgi:hypothetical protein
MKRKALRGEAKATFAFLADQETDDCVLWPFGTSDGYGAMYASGFGPRLTHREALIRRSPPPFVGALALHGPCHDPLCMNYRHLSWGTRTDNQEDRLRDVQSGRKPPQRQTDRRTGG